MLYIALGCVALAAFAWAGGRRQPFLKRREWRLLSAALAVACFAGAAFVGLRGEWGRAIVLVVLGLWLASTVRVSPGAVGPKAAPAPTREMSASEARSILGVGPEFHYEVLSKEDWFGRRLIANKFREGRVFIAGDAAHIWVPYAGYGMNAGIADATNLSWLLAAHLNVWGQYWFSAKLLLVVILSGYNGWIGAYSKKLAKGHREVDDRKLRLMNELPGIFTAFIMYDLKRVRDGEETNYVSATLGVYLSIYNVFQSLLALLGIFGGSRD